ncbi:PadR family transcriptional regulator [Desulfatibacillum aliphaticivorans]|uniref:PadR family transcriptional regulator n=1 Tax=Desulfatibacillum aliphaticivorans TaxID=218208 RepID=UPI00040EAF26|nr:PadR family transcriptional regulator [Desulfatibacillum aliphaticivorans]
MDIQTMILGFLMNQDMTGYDIRQKFDMSFGFFSGLSYGSIYPALKKMEAAGLITTQLMIQEGAPNKKLCAVTDKGREAFHEAMRAPLGLDKYKNSFMARLFFFAHLEPYERRTLAVNYMNSLNKMFEKLREYEPIIRAHADPFELLCFECGLRFAEDVMSNMQDTVKALEESGLDKN